MILNFRSALSSDCNNILLSSYQYLSCNFILFTIVISCRCNEVLEMLTNNFVGRQANYSALKFDSPSKRGKDYFLFYT